MNNYIGIDIGGTKTAVVFAEAGEEIHFLEKKVFPTKTPEETLEIVKNFIAAVLKENQVCGIGISCGSPMSEEKGIILSPPNLPDWKEIHIREFFENTFQIPTALRNDANACALAEWRFGAGQGVSNMVFLTFGTGMGAGLILNGKLYSGADSMAGEVGHIKIQSSSVVCYGIAGSFESCCSGAGLAKTAISRAKKDFAAENLIKKAGGIEKINAKIIDELAREGDAFCRKIYTDCGKSLGRGIAILADLLNPERIVLGSIYARSKDLLEKPMRRELKKYALPMVLENLQIVPAQLGETVGDTAAVCAAMEAL